MAANEQRKGPRRVPKSSIKSGGDENASGGNVGNALRGIYNQTVDEAIPSEMLDLLGKLS